MKRLRNSTYNKLIEENSRLDTFNKLLMIDNAIMENDMEELKQKYNEDIRNLKNKLDEKRKDFTDLTKTKGSQKKTSG